MQKKYDLIFSSLVAFDVLVLHESGLEFVKSVFIPKKKPYETNPYMN